MTYLQATCNTHLLLCTLVALKSTATSAHDSMALSYGKIHVREQHAQGHAWSQGWIFLVEIFTPGPGPSNWVNWAENLPSESISFSPGFPSIIPTDQKKFHDKSYSGHSSLYQVKKPVQSHIVPNLRTTFTFTFSDQFLLSLSQNNLSHFSYFLAYRGSASVSGPRLPPNCEKSF